MTVLARPAPWRSVLSGLAALLLTLAGARLAGVVGPAAIVVAAAGYLVAATVVLARRHARRFGLANSVTLIRLVGTCTAGGLAVEAVVGTLPVGSRLIMVGIAAGCLVLDGVDGRVARSRREVSDFGARFDMETDAALLLVLSVAVVALGVAGWWALAIAGLRYAYVLVGLAVPALQRPLPVRLSRKVIAVIQGIALCVVLVVDLVIPGPVPTTVLLLSLALLLWSFGRDVVWQLRHS